MWSVSAVMGTVLAIDAETERNQDIGTRGSFNIADAGMFCAGNIKPTRKYNGLCAAGYSLVRIMNI